MDMILKDQPLKYEIADKTIFISPKNPHKSLSPVTPTEWLAPPVRIKVVDSLGEPLSGITVSLKRSRVLGVTDAEGVFTARVKPGDVLVFSSVGFQSLELTVSDKSTLTVILAQAITNLEGVSVVSTGFQTLNKNRATGTIEHVGQDILANRPNTDLSSMLQGVVAGMQGLESANGNVTFTIRGISTLGTTNNQRSPLIVIDGFPLMNGDFFRHQSKRCGKRRCVERRRCFCYLGRPFSERCDRDHHQKSKRQAGAYHRRQRFYPYRQQAGS